MSGISFLFMAGGIAVTTIVVAAGCAWSAHRACAACMRLGLDAEDEARVVAAQHVGVPWP